MLVSLVEEHHFAAQRGQQKADLLRYIAGVESCAEDLLKRDASEKSVISSFKRFFFQCVALHFCE